MIELTCEQGSAEWFKHKLGIPSASCFDRIITTKGEPSKQREKYMFKLAGEIITGISEESYTSGPMQRGKEMEEEACQLHQLITGKETLQCGFFVKDGYGATPDRIMPENGLLEVKCPILTTQVGYLLDNKLPTEYFQQVQGELLVTEKEYAHFFSYFPGLKPLLIRVEPDKKFQEILRSELLRFCDELKILVEKLK